MFHVQQIKEGMPVRAKDHETVGTVDHVVGLFIMLDQLRYLPIDLVSRIEGGVVHLRVDFKDALDDIAICTPALPSQISA